MEKREAEYGVGRDHAKRQEKRGRANGRHRVPEIIIGDKHVGGYDDKETLERRGKLEQMLNG